MRDFILCLVAFALLPTVAHAYLDPGTGSIILQALVAGIVSMSVAFSSLRLKIKMFVQSLFKSKNKANKDIDE